MVLRVHTEERGSPAPDVGCASGLDWNLEATGRLTLQEETKEDNTEVPDVLPKSTNYFSLIYRPFWAHTCVTYYST